MDDRITGTEPNEEMEIEAEKENTMEATEEITVKESAAKADKEINANTNTKTKTVKADEETNTKTKVKAAKADKEINESTKVKAAKVDKEINANTKTKTAKADEETNTKTKVKVKAAKADKEADKSTKAKAAKADKETNASTKTKTAKADKEANNKCQDVERSIVKKYRKEIWRKFTKAVNEYDLIQDGDRIAVCISGGKDSMLMAKLFQELWRHGKRNFELTYLVMNPGYNDLNYELILQNANLLNVPIVVFKTEIFNTVADITDSPCYLCARMRRGYLYSKAKELGCNKIALGHHYDDVIETILMGMLYGGQIQTMMPKLHSANFEGMELIRPMYLIREEDIIKWMHYNELRFIRCACRFTELIATQGDKESSSKRMEVKALIKELQQKSPFIETNIFRSVENVNLSTIIAYKQNGIKHHFLDEYDSREQ